MVMLFYLLVSSATTLAEVLTEVVVKLLNGAPHVSQAPFFVFLGADVENVNRKPWFILPAVSCALPYTASLLVYQWLRAR